MRGQKHTAYMLDAGLVVDTIERLHARIEDRFPQSGLGKVCADLAEVGRRTGEHAKHAYRPYVGTRLLTLIFVFVWLVLLFRLGSLVNWSDQLSHADLVSVAQPLESLVNLTLLMGGATWFLWTREAHMKRKRIFRALYQLRSMAHVIDMHQLTKDPSIELKAYTETANSPKRAMSDFELSRYLDYCTEMLSLIAKLAALYSGHTEDTQILEATNDIEVLTTNLGRKIWQKIMIIGQIGENSPLARR